jgi:hypothetical protein
MMHDKQTAAIARYKAMDGQMKDLPLAAARRARADQKRYAEEYLPKRGKGIAAPLKMIRFLVDVCGLSLREGSWAVRRDLEKIAEQPWEPQGETVPEMARKLYRAAGDMLDAVALARFYAWIAFDPDFWNEVRNHLVAMTVTEEATGIENWPEAAE